MNQNKKELKKQTKEGLLEMTETENYEGGVADAALKHSKS